MSGGRWRLVLWGAILPLLHRHLNPRENRYEARGAQEGGHAFLHTLPLGICHPGTHLPRRNCIMAMAITIAVAPGALSGPAGDKWLMEMAPSESILRRRSSTL